MSWIGVLLFAHIASGGTALLTGGGAAIFPKGKKLHKLAGNVFFWSMLLSTLTAIAISAVNFSPLLLSIGLFTLYLIAGGKIVLAIKDTNQLKVYWTYYSWFGLASAGVMLMTGSIHLGQNPVAAVILYVFSGILLTLSAVDFKKNPALKPQRRLYQHINKMGGAYIAAFTAFLVVNFSFLPPLAGWIGPSVIGSILIAAAIRKQRKVTRSAVK